MKTKKEEKTEGPSLLFLCHYSKAKIAALPKSDIIPQPIEENVIIVSPPLGQDYVVGIYIQGYQLLSKSLINLTPPFI